MFITRALAAAVALAGRREYDHQVRRVCLYLSFDADFRITESHVRADVYDAVARRARGVDDAERVLFAGHERGGVATGGGGRDASD